MGLHFLKCKSTVLCEYIFWRNRSRWNSKTVASNTRQMISFTCPRKLLWLPWNGNRSTSIRTSHNSLMPPHSPHSSKSGLHLPLAVYWWFSTSWKIWCCTILFPASTTFAKLTENKCACNRLLQHVLLQGDLCLMAQRLIASLKSQAAKATVPNAKRVEVVSALIWKCVMESTRRSNGEHL